MVARAERPERNGFSIIEVVVAVVILTFGLLAMATSTGYVFRQIRDAGHTTDRAIAVQQAIERIRAMQYNNVLTRDSAHAVEIDEYALWWDVTTIGNMKRVVVVCMGPGYTKSVRWAAAVKDTTLVSVLSPT